MTFDETEKFIDWLLLLNLPGRPPKFDSKAEKEKYIREWHQAFKTTPVAYFRSLMGSLRDNLKRWPTISDMKGEIAMFLRSNPLSEFNDINPEFYTEFQGQHIQGGYAILTKEQAERIEAKYPGFTKNILRLNKKTGEITDAVSGRSEGNILERKKEGEADKPKSAKEDPGFRLWLKNVLDAIEKDDRGR